MMERNIMYALDAALCVRITDTLATLLTRQTVTK